MMSNAAKGLISMRTEKGPLDLATRSLKTLTRPFKCREISRSPI